MSGPSQIVSFELTCPEPRVWLVLKNDHGNCSVVPMCQRCPSEWSATAALTPGEYLCRYYGGDEQRVIYYGAAKIQGSIDRGMDAWVSVV
jgi:hypothetical protein